jgi:purine-nucleoside/S-methyl-5'-thioadenosine phosphorylase / adenosine deaminase
MTSAATRLQETDTDRPVPVLELREWADRYGLIAGITTRGDGFNLGLLTPDPAADVLDRWRTFAAAVAPGFRTLAAGLQVHGRAVAVHDRSEPGWIIGDGVDGHATREAGVLCCVSVADCIPVYLAHPPSGAVGLLHAGWRGIASGVLEAGLASLRTLGATGPADVVMHCGVGICGMCYEVGPEVITAVTGTVAPGKGPLDLRAVLATRAAHAGVGTISVSGWCAAHDASRFFSHRRSGGTDGRMLAYLGRPLA